MRTTGYLASVLFLIGLTTRAFAVAGDLEKPSLAFPEGFPESARTNILAVLERTDCKFIRGHFVNWFTSLGYGGDTVALNLFLAGLARCPGVILSVRFQSDRASDDSAWLVSHSADKPWEFTVHVNVKSIRMKVDELVIPPSKGPPLVTRLAATRRRVRLGDGFYPGVGSVGHGSFWVGVGTWRIDGGWACHRRGSEASPVGCNSDIPS